jgi:putative transposase
MSRAYSQVYVHLVWGTERHRPFLVGEVQRRLYAALRATCGEMGVFVVAVGGVEDHVHLLVQLPPALSVAAVAQRLKGSSSHLLNHESPSSAPFRWKTGYGAFSVSRRNVPGVRDYVLNQPIRHATAQLSPALETMSSP